MSETNGSETHAPLIRYVGFRVFGVKPTPHSAAAYSGLSLVVGIIPGWGPSSSFPPARSSFITPSASSAATTPTVPEANLPCSHGSDSVSTLVAAGRPHRRRPPQRLDRLYPRARSRGHGTDAAIAAYHLARGRSGRACRWSRSLPAP